MYLHTPPSPPGCSHNICKFKYPYLGTGGSASCTRFLLLRETGLRRDFQDKFLPCQSRYLDRQALDVAPTHCYWLPSSPLGSLYEYSASICISFVSNINTGIQNISRLLLSCRDMGLQYFLLLPSSSKDMSFDVRCEAY